MQLSRHGTSTDSSASPGQRGPFLWSLLGAMLLLAALAGPFLAGRIYTKDDLGAFHIPTRAFYAERLTQGEPFDWMPQLYSGFYLTGEGQVGTYHPVHLAIYRFLPLHWAIGCEWLAAYPMLLAGMFLFLRRRLGRSDVAMFGSLVFTFSGFNLLHFVHPNAIAVVAHIPWLLWLIDVVLVDSSGRKVTLALAAIALLTGSQLLLGYPQYVWFSLLAEVAYVGVLLIGRERILRAAGREEGASDVESLSRWRSRSVRLVLAKLCGLMLGAVQLLPTAAALSHSTRQVADGEFSSMLSLHPANLIQMVAPYMRATRTFGCNTHEGGLYFGAVPLMLIVWLWVRRRDLGALRVPAGVASLLGFLALLMALGKFSPLYSLQTVLPVVGHFRGPCRYIVLVHLATAIAAAMGLLVLMKDAARCRSDRPLVTGQGPVVSSRQVLAGLPRSFWVVGGVCFGVALAGLIAQGNDEFSSVPAVLIGPVLLGTAALLVALAAAGVRGALAALILFAAIDLGTYGMTYAVYPRTIPLAEFPSATLLPPGRPNGRILASSKPLGERVLRYPNSITMAGWHRADGYAGLEPLQRLDYSQLATLRVAGVQWVRRDSETEKIEGLVQRDERWLEVPRMMALPRARLVTRTRQSDQPGRDLAKIDVATTVLTDVPIRLPESVPGRVEIISERPGYLHFQSDCESPQLLAVSESYHRGWQATVERSRRQVLRINGDFLGCRVGPGRQDVVFEFRPRSLYWGKLVSTVGLALLVLITAGCLFFPKLHSARQK